MGKTTLAIHLADGLARRRSRVLLIDADPQQTAMKWSTFQAGKHGFQCGRHGYANPAQGATADRGRLHRHRHRRSATHPQPGEVHHLGCRSGPHPRATPSPADVWATAETVDLVTEAQSFKETIKSAIIVNRKIGNTVIGRDVRDALATLNTPILQADISQARRVCRGVRRGQDRRRPRPERPGRAGGRTLHHRTCEGLEP